MKSCDLWKYALAILASLGTVLPGSLVTAADAISTTELSPQIAKKTAPTIQDVSLGAQGELTGFILGRQGKAVARTKVVVKRGRKVVAETSTGKFGQFRISGLRGGVYQIVHSDGAAVFRVWKNGTAPKSARQNALVVVGKRLVRGQNEVGLLSALEPASLASLGIGVAGLVVGIVGISEANKANDKVDALAATLN